ncbi:hypothetical protein [Halorubrum sp. SY-15]|uniref:hypothetical protein n=1 Tax=Halorubrum sp. SY-15 TaxID=3402277 RepID=UPI003EBBB6CF
MEDASDESTAEVPGESVEGVPDESVEDRPTVAMSCTSPDRTVFTEEGNTDAWIATDMTVELDR